MLLEACLCALALQLPDSAAAVTGAVRDASTGQAVAGAELVLVDLGRRAVTDREGRYRFAGVPAGPQHLSASMLGYAPRTVHVLVPGAGAVELDLALRPRPLRLPQVQATLPPPPPAAGDSGGGDAFADRAVTGRSIRNHPWLAEPDPLRALAGGGVVVEPEAPAGVHVRGGAADQTGYLLNGVPVLSPYHAAGLFSAVNPDALARVGLAAGAPPPAFPDALSGTITMVTREPGSRFQARGSASNTQTRVTVDGPVGGRAGYLLSWRSSFPSDVWRQNEPSYLMPESSDLLATARAGTLGGRASALLYNAENEITASAGDGAPPGERNEFAWRSRSLGGEWRRTAGGSDFLVRGWWTSLAASSRWNEARAGTRLGAKRADVGVVTSYTHETRAGSTELGARLHRIDTRYRAAAADAALDASGAVLAGSLFAEHRRVVRSWLNARAGASVTHALGAVLFSPRARLELTGPAGLSGSLAGSRTQQLAQSVRNPESVVGRIFPADLYLAAGVAGVPVARSDQVAVAAAWRALPGLQLELQAFARALDRLLLAAPVEPEPFAHRPATTGSGTARGASLDVTASGARYSLLLSYGWQRVRLEHGDSAYLPSHGSTHQVDAGVSIYPGATSVLRLALSGVAGRRATAVTGPFEWESCNLLDQGCEFAGSPRLDGPRGGVRLPAYVRIDIGGRHHWHLRVGGREAQVALFGTITNVLGRRNVLTQVRDTATGRFLPVEMLPRSPLVVGLDWQF